MNSMQHGTSLNQYLFTRFRIERVK